jgi:MFS family permease
VSTAAAPGDSVSRMASRELRALFVVTGAIVFVDTMFYAAVVPLLPTLTRQLHLSKASAGVLTASYALGTLAGSLPGGRLASRRGPRAAVYVGLLLMACSSVAFGFLDNVALLDGARFVQGVGGGYTWAGSLAWLIAAVPVNRRGSTIGRALAAGIGGALFGPVIGTLAHEAGRAPVFSAVVVVAGALAVTVRLLPAPPPPAAQPRRTRLLEEIRDPATALSLWLVVLPAIASGVINVLAPLRLSALGASAIGIGATFLIAAALEAVISPAVGRISDRRGRLLPLRVGLAASAVVLLLFAPSENIVVVAAVVVLAAVTLGSFWAPAIAMTSDVAAARGVPQGYAMALANLAWAAGQIVGAGGGGTLAKASGDAVPFAISSALCVLTLAMLVFGPLSDRLQRG